jgi:hypothetical protein
MVNLTVNFIGPTLRNKSLKGTKEKTSDKDWAKLTLVMQESNKK